MDSELSKPQSFIERLNDVLEKNYHDENFGVSELASHVAISRSQLHRKLKILKGITASQFIMSFRLHKAYALLMNDERTVSEIAYVVGFNSPSYFSTCFKDYYKFPPGEAKNKQVEIEDGVWPNAYSSRVKIFFSKRYGIISIGIIVIAILTYALTGVVGGGSDKTETVVLGVLPFKNLSNDPSNQYFADGVMEVILNHLSNIDDFYVLSRTTMDQYRETDKTVPEIASELNITHVMEASIQKDSDKVRVVVQLIDAKQDRHLWAESYERTYLDIFSLQSDIAKEVARQLQRNLSHSNLSKIEELPTENVEAYNLYLKGRFFWHRRTKEDLEKSIHYFEQALGLDPNYALAYAGLADAFFIKSWWSWDENYESQIKGKDYALKALSIDTKLAHAYATLGGISTWFDWNWDQAEKELKQAILLDPNYATAYQYYAELLDILGRKEEAREQINLALKHNPNSRAALNISADIYYNSGNFEKAMVDTQRSFEIKGTNNDFLYVKYYFRLGQHAKAFKYLKKMLPDSLKNSSKIDSLNENSGISGIISNYIDSLDLHNNYTIASYYCLAGVPKKALDYLEKSYEAKEPELPNINSMLDFKTLKTEPRFMTLLDKMNLN